MARIANPPNLGLELLDAAGTPYQPYDFGVSIENFDSDHSLGWGPGHYSGVEVTAAAAARWDAGILAVRDRDLDLVDRLSIRLHLLRGGEVDTWDPAAPDPWLDDVRARHAAEQAVDDADRDARQARLDRIGSLLDGLDRTQYGLDRTQYGTTEPSLADDLGELLYAEPHAVGMLSGRPHEWTDVGSAPDGPVSKVWRQGDGTLLHFLRGPNTGTWRLYGDSDVCDRYRSRAAAEMGITIEEAREGVESAYIDADQRQMYVTVLAEADR